MNEYPNIKKLIEVYNKAVNSRQKDIRLSTNEVQLILSDITKMSLNHNVQIDTLKKIEQILQMIIQDGDNSF